MLQPSALVTSTWPTAGETDELQGVIAAQAKTIHEQFALLHDYQDVLDAAQVQPKTTAAVSTATGTTLNVLGTQGVIEIGATVTAIPANPGDPVPPGVPPGTVILSQISGTTGGDGAYTTSLAITAAASTNLQFTPSGAPATWPPVTAADDLMNVVAAQTLIIRTQTALAQQYIDLLNTSETPVPPP